jgi:GNAT superfamily N-acetyltransferase
MKPSSKFIVESGYLPGAIGRIAELHGTYYHIHWNFGLFFEAKVAVELSEFLKRYDINRDGMWTATIENRVEASIVIDGIHAQTDGAHLRWFIVSDALRGKGAGRILLEQAITFCNLKKYEKVYLWTFEGLDAARHLYEDAGFALVKQKSGVQWGKEVNEQCFELDIRP